MKPEESEFIENFSFRYGISPTYTGTLQDAAKAAFNHQLLSEVSWF